MNARWLSIFAVLLLIIISAGQPRTEEELSGEELVYSPSEPTQLGFVGQSLGFS